MSLLLLTFGISYQFPFIFNESLSPSDLYWWVTQHKFSLTALHASSVVRYKISLKEQMGSPLSMCVGENEWEKEQKKDNERVRENKMKLRTEIELCLQVIC